jgi:LAO/AO transport system kinase
VEPAQLVEKVLSGDRRALARAISHVEANSPAGRELHRHLYPRTGRARTVGVTGPAGAGKSTLVGRIAIEEHRRGRTVGIVAVDPSSPISHGAILGDRIRMQELALCPGIFMRSMASRGNLGGLSETATSVVDVLDATGFDVVLIETVGAGQDEVEIATTAQTTVLVTTPGAGDEIQAMKAGLMEVAQILVVNKADLDGADTAVAQLEALRSLSGMRAWNPPILKAVATTGDGIVDLVDAIDAHQAHVRDSAHTHSERRELARRQIFALAQAALHRRAREMAMRSQALDALVTDVMERRRDPRSAAELLLEALWRESVGDGAK